jgi:hypothetical protein
LKPWLLALLPMGLSGCLAVWAASFPRYFEVQNATPDGGPLPDGDTWLCQRERGEAVLHCAPPEVVWACPLGER